MKVIIIKYNAGNARSVSYSLERIGINAIISDDIEEIRSADKIIFPGVGAAGPAMAYLKERKLDEVIVSLKQPLLGICLGMQLLCERSEEGDVKCLSVFDENVKKIAGDIKIPHVGWNNIAGLNSPLFNDIPDGSFMYFVHSYYVPLCPFTVAQTDYAGIYSAALQKNNFYAVQFHPEKSGEDGQKVLENFIKL